MAEANKTYVIHRGNKNQKVRGKLIETVNSQTGQRFLVGEELIKTLHWKDGLGATQVDECYAPLRIEVTGLSITVRG